MTFRLLEKTTKITVDRAVKGLGTCQSHTSDARHLANDIWEIIWHSTQSTMLYKSANFKLFQTVHSH